MPLLPLALRLSIGCLLGLLLATSPTMAQGRGESLERLSRGRTELTKLIIPELLDLAQKAKELRFHGDSQSLFKKILLLDPESREARKALRYHRVSSDRWVQSKSFKRSYNRRTKGLGEFRQRVNAVMLPFRDGLLELVDEVFAEQGLYAGWMELERLRPLFLGDEILLTRLGEVRTQNGWVLVESDRALRGGKAFPELARDCLRLAPKALPATVRTEERELSLALTAARMTSDVRVLGSTPAAEVGAAASLSHAVGDFFRHALQSDGQHRDDFTIYLMDRTERDAFLRSWPGLSQEALAGLAMADGGWLGKGNRLAEWSSLPARRLDGAARQTLGTLLMDSFGIDAGHGWAWEGAGLYLVHTLLGTRLTWFFNPEGYAPQASSGLWVRLQAPDVCWYAEAARMIERGGAPGLVYLLGRGVNAMREQDVLYSFALAAYLFEGHRQSVPSLFRRIGAGEHPVHVFEEELGVPLPVIEGRLLRWIAETR